MIGTKVARVQPGPTTGSVQRVQGRKMNKEENKKSWYLYFMIFNCLFLLFYILYSCYYPFLREKILSFFTIEKLFGPLYRECQLWLQLIRALRAVNAYGRSGTTVGKWDDEISARGIRHASRFWQWEYWPCFLIKTENIFSGNKTINLETIGIYGSGIKRRINQKRNRNPCNHW